MADPALIVALSEAEASARTANERALAIAARLDDQRRAHQTAGLLEERERVRSDRQVLSVLLEHLDLYKSLLEPCR